MDDNNSCILLFDGVCNLCNNFVRFVVERDSKRKFKFASLQSESGQTILKKFGLPTNGFDSFVFINKGKIFLRSSAGLNVFKELGGIWKLFYVFIFVPQFLRDPIYGVIAKNRYKIFGKRNTCMTPTSDIKQIFLE